MARLIFSLCAVALASSAACSDPAPTTSSGDAGADANVDASTGPKPEWQGGTRLRPIVTSVGSVERLEAFHDTLLDVDCGFVLLGDGAAHCAPLPTSAAIYFTDPGCTQKIAGRTPRCATEAAPRYATYTDDAAPACTPREIVELGPTTAPSVTYRRSGGACTAFTDANMVFQSVVRSVPPSEFVPATIVREPRGPDLVMSYHEAADGARSPRAIEATGPRAGACNAEYASGDVLRCVPNHVALVTGHFSDPGCTSIAAELPSFVGEECKLPPIAVRRGDADGCGLIANHFFEAGAPRTTIFQSTGACVAATPSSLRSTFYDVGAPIADTAFPRLTLTPGATSPVAASWLTVDTGERVGRPTFWDTAHAIACEPTLAVDNQLRCMPTPSGLAYADDTCQTPIVLATHVDGCAPFPPPAFARDVASPQVGCQPATLRIYRVGAALPKPTQYWVKSGTSCVATTSVKFYDFYATSGEVPPSEFAPVTRTTK